MYISYSGHATFHSCRKAFYLGYIAKVPLMVPDNRVNMLYGDAVGKIFERFYRDELWRSNVTSRLLALVKPTIDGIIAAEVRKGGVFDWDDPALKPGTRSLAQVIEEVRTTIPRALASIRHHWLVGLDAKAEVSLDCEVEGHRFGGRADFVMTRARTKDLVLVDGKGSRYRDAYTDHRQLRWYSMLYELKFGRIPDKVGFLYWRSEPQESMDWSVVRKEQLRDLRVAVLATLSEIARDQQRVSAGEPEFSVFFPTPKVSGCKFCRFRPQCAEGRKVLSEDYKAERAEALARGVDEGDVGF